MTILVSNEGSVRTIIINRPDCRNAVDPDTATGLRTAFADFMAAKIGGGSSAGMQARA